MCKEIDFNNRIRTVDVGDISGRGIETNTPRAVEPSVVKIAECIGAIQRYISLRVRSNGNGQHFDIQNAIRIVTDMCISSKEMPDEDIAKKYGDISVDGVRKIRDAYIFGQVEIFEPVVRNR